MQKIERIECRRATAVKLTFRAWALLLVLAWALASAPSAHAQDSGRFQTGFDAYKKGDFATAIYYWRPLAENGDVQAQFNIGIMYLYGQGVKVDVAEAVKWFSIARDAHFPPAIKTMDELETSSKLNPGDLSEGLSRRDAYEKSHAP